MNAKLCRVLYRCSSAIATRRNRFYEKAQAVFKPTKQIYKIYLDKHCLVTPKRREVELSSEALALAVAEEWNTQEDELKTDMMRLTGLVCTAIDNPMSLEKSDIVSNVLTFLDNDTILYRHRENQKLMELQRNRWDPVVNWVNSEYGLSIKPSYAVGEEVLLDEAFRSRLANQLLNYSFLQLTGLQYATESLKSLLLTLAVVSCHLHIDEAVELTLLEQEYQTSVWGKVEWAHSTEKEEVISRSSAGILVVHLANSDSEKEAHSELKKSW